MQVTRFLLALMLAFLVACPPAERTDPPSTPVLRGAFTVSLELSGELAAVRSVPVVVPDIGTGAQVTFIAPQGQRVGADDVVVELDRSELERQLIDARNRLEIAKTRIGQGEAQLELRLADLSAAVERSELSLQGSKMRVTDSEAVPRVERESARLDVQAATLALDQARASLEQARLQGEAQLELLAIQARQGREKLERIKARLAATTLRAPEAGVVVHAEAPEGRPVGQGYMVYPGTTVVLLADPTGLQVETWVHELDAGRLVAGQRVAVVLEAYPERTFAGQVVSIGDMAVSQGSAGPGKRLLSIIALDELDEAMRPGMSVRAEIEVEHLEDVLSVPREAVFEDGERSYVLLRGSAGWEQVTVQAGTTNDTHMVVEGELAAGDKVALARPGGAGSAPGSAGEVGS